MADEASGLSQLAKVYEEVADLDRDAPLTSLMRKVLDGRITMEKQLTRRREFERQIKDSSFLRGQVVDQQFNLQQEKDLTLARMEHLKDQIDFIREIQSHSQKDIDVVKGRVGSNLEVRDVISKMKEEKERAGQSHLSVRERREKLKAIFRMKSELQEVQEKMLERKRQVGQDRSLLLHAIDALQDELARAREERLELSEERQAMQHEMADIELERLIAKDAAAERAGVTAEASAPGPMAYAVQQPRTVYYDF